MFGAKGFAKISSAPLLTILCKQFELRSAISIMAANKNCFKIDDVEFYIKDLQYLRRLMTNQSPLGRFPFVKQHLQHPYNR